MAFKKILIFSGGGLDRVTESFEHSFQSLGHTTEIYFHDHYRISLGLFKFFSRTPFTYLNLKYWERYKEVNSAQYEEKIKLFKPDLIFFYNFNSISIKLFKKIKKYYKIPTAYMVFADPLIAAKNSSYFLTNLIYCSHLFFINSSAIPSLRLISDASMHILPLAGDPRFYKPLRLKKDIDLFLMGQFSSISTATVTKAYILDYLCAEGFRVSAAGPGLEKLIRRPEFPHLKNLEVITTSSLPIEEVNVLYNRSKIVLAPEHPRDKDAPSPRAFEAALAGSFPLADYQRDAEQLFEGHLVTFRSVKEMADQVKYYLNHEEERENIASQLYQVTLRRHTYVNRAKEVLRVVFPP
ncbi:MAG: glycosyltransferase family 1 protein [Candidatus Liptonbacteria bacterium]|nr:glycosyltransferase family 1 protein [Candidatus Liptonbacteria bacterium]